MSSGDFQRLAVAVYHFMRAEDAGGRVPNNRIQQIDDVHSPAHMMTTCESRANSDKPANRREHCEHRKRHPHRRRRFMWNVRMVLGCSVIFVSVMPSRVLVSSVE